MLNILLQKNLFIQWFVWYFLEAPKGILRGWKNILVFNLNYFSVPLLLKTLFSHWHQYQWYYPRGFDLGKYLEVIFSNTISRVLGAIVRLIMIVLGIVIEILIFFAGIAIIIVWFLMPVLVFLAAGHGLRLLLKNG
ncbi:MAG: hypothetical protein Q8N16_01285 [bacterium]|nr:hypothetical protein [bacterium]